MYAPLSPKTEIEVVSAQTAIEDEVIRIASAGKSSIISRGHPEWVHGECSDKTNLSGILRDLKEQTVTVPRSYGMCLDRSFL